MAKTVRRINDYIVEGNTVRRVQSVNETDERPVQAARKKQRASKRMSRIMNAGYLFGLTMSLIAGALVLTWYLSLQNEISATLQRVSALEKELGTLTKENDETYNRINGSVDLEEIRRIAIEEYGMRYVGEGQVVTYSDGGGSDYVRQRGEIPGGGN